MSGAGYGGTGILGGTSVVPGGRFTIRIISWNTTLNFIDTIVKSVLAGILSN